MSEQLGSAAEEATRLFAALEDWARRRGGPLAPDDSDEHRAGAGGAATCQVCPVCQGIAALRAVRPETVEHLLDAAASLVAALRSTVSQPDPDSSPARPQGVERIDVREF